MASHWPFVLKTIGSEERLLIQNLKITQGCEQCLERELQLSSILGSLFPSLYHHIDKPYGITISLPPYSNMLVVLTYLKSTYVFDYLQHLSTT